MMKHANCWRSLACLVLLAGCAHPAPQPAPVPPPAPPAPPPIPRIFQPAPEPDPVAPDSFLVAVETSRGPVVLSVHRDWAPHGVDRFYELVQRGYYDSARVHRVVPKFVVQFGLAADPKATAIFLDHKIPDDSVRGSNLRGTVSFASAGPGTRTAQLFINLVDNVRLDGKAGGAAYPPIARVVSGMEAVDSFTTQYSAAGPAQGRLQREGNAYLATDFPNLDFIISMRITQEWKQ